MNENFFENTIREYLKENASIKDVADDFTRALNAIQKERDEQSNLKRQKIAHCKTLINAALDYIIKFHPDSAIAKNPDFMYEVTDEDAEDFADEIDSFVSAMEKLNNLSAKVADNKETLKDFFSSILNF